MHKCADGIQRIEKKVRVDLRLEQGYLHLFVLECELALLFLLPLLALEITNHIIDTDGNDVLIVKTYRIPAQQLHHVLLPVLEVHQPLHVIVEIVRERTHDKVKLYKACEVASDLNPSLEAGKPVCPKENQENKNAKRLEKEKGVPEYVRFRVNELPLNDATDGEVKCVPGTDQ